MNILIGSASSIPTPPSGEATLFINTDNGNILSYKLPDGTVKPYSASSVDECCSCELAKMLTKAVACALESGFITMTEFNTFVNSGFNIFTSEVTDSSGNKTCTVTLGPPVVLPVSIEITDYSPDMLTETIYQMVAQFTPSNTTNQAKIWVSSNTAALTISPSGLATAIGDIETDVTVYVYSAANPSIYDSVVIHVTPAP